MFTYPENGAMHMQMNRLYEAAEKLRGIRGPSDIARAMNASPQTINNWESRGMSQAGMLKAQAVFGCSATWLADGNGPMAVGAPRCFCCFDRRTAAGPEQLPDRATSADAKRADAVPGAGAAPRRDSVLDGKAGNGTDGDSSVWLALRVFIRWQHIQ
jgi:hypothetical protein